MTLSKTQDKVGTPREVSKNPTKRSGRDSGFGKSGSIGHPHSVSTNKTSRGGGADGTGPVGPAQGVGRGRADKGSSGASRLKGDGVGSPFPTP